MGGVGEVQGPAIHDRDADVREARAGHALAQAIDYAWREVGGRTLAPRRAASRARAPAPLTASRTLAPGPPGAAVEDARGVARGDRLYGVFEHRDGAVSAFGPLLCRVFIGHPELGLRRHELVHAGLQAALGELLFEERVDAGVLVGVLDLHAAVFCGDVHILVGPHLGIEDGVA